MSLKAIHEKGGPFVAAALDIRARLASLGNRVGAASALLPTFLTTGGRAQALGDAPPAKPVLSGGAVPDTATTRAALKALFDAVAVPTVEEIAAASGGLVGKDDAVNVQAIIRSEAVARFVIEACAARLPGNDI